QGEFYLTDTVEILRARGSSFEAFVASDPEEMIGVNSRRDLAQAEAILRRRILQGLMDSGVTIIDPATTYVDSQTRIAADTILHPGTIIRGASTIETGAEIGPYSTIIDSQIGKNARVWQSVVEGARLEPG